MLLVSMWVPGRTFSPPWQAWQSPGGTLDRRFGIPEAAPERAKKQKTPIKDRMVRERKGLILPDRDFRCVFMDGISEVMRKRFNFVPAWGYPLQARI
jgi:hypothetical protein